jgi:hypothetical protein
MGNLDAIAVQILPYIGASLGAYLIYIIGQQLSKGVFKQNTSARVRNLIGAKDEDKKIKPSDFGSPEFKIRLAFSRYNMDVYQHEICT